MALSEKEVLRQSEAAFMQWKDIWEKHSKFNGELLKMQGTSHCDLLGIGAGKSLLCIANAPSFENEIETIKKYINRENTDIICVDKCMCQLIENGIIPNFVILADAGIDYNTWCENYIEYTKNITLISNVNANIEWTKNWKGKIIFYVNKDNIQSEKIYCELSGCKEVIPASSNVGNTVIVFATQIMGYDEYYLIGYDYCWGDEDNYYAFTDSEKRYWMKHLYLIDSLGRFVNTSQNLLFSARWLSDFYNAVLKGKIKIFNCSRKGILNIPYVKLEKKLKYAQKRELKKEEKNNIIMNRLKHIIVEAKDGEQGLKNALMNKHIYDITIRYIPEEILNLC